MPIQQCRVQRVRRDQQVLRVLMEVLELVDQRVLRVQLDLQVLKEVHHLSLVRRVLRVQRVRPLLVRLDQLGRPDQQVLREVGALAALRVQPGRRVLQILVS